MVTATMTVNVHLFAGLQGIVGQADVQVSLRDGATVAQLRDRLVEEYPQLEPFMNTLVCAVGEEMVPVEQVLSDGDRIDLIPPISGG